MSKTTVKLDARLRQLIERTEGAYLPSLSSLRRTFDVSMPTLCKAAGRLREAGLLDFDRGRAPRIVSRLVEAPPLPRVDAVERVRNVVRSSIMDGEIRFGAQLPKLSAYTHTYAVSDHTVRKALAGLVRDGTIHRRGKTHYAGPSPTAAPPLDGQPPPFIVILQRSWSDWQWIFKADRAEEFASVFYQEAERTGTELVPVIATADDSHNLLYNTYIAGEEAILGYIREHRARYRGTLLCSRTYTSPDLAGWITRLTALGKPVVWFDSSHLGLTSPVKSYLFTLCTMDEARVSRCAVEALTRFGHRRIGYPLDDTVPWQVERLALMREAAARPGNVLDAVALPVVAAPPDATRLAAVLRRLAEISALPRHRLGESLTRNERTFPDMNWMFAGLADPDISALVAPSDEQGSRMFAWLASLRVHMPERFSLLSFDNYRSYRALPLSSVNFGFGRLGYFAFHSILRLIPTPRDQHGAILSQPFVAHRGSLGPACKD